MESDNRFVRISVFGPRIETLLRNKKLTCPLPRIVSLYRSFRMPLKSRRDEGGFLLPALTLTSWFLFMVSLSHYRQTEAA